MPTGPKGEKRPADVVANAVKVARIVTGEIEDDAEPGKEYAREGGRKGGRMRAHKLSSERRSEIARLGAEVRWRKSRR